MPASAIAPRLELRQGQTLVMTQQLQQSIKLLQLSALELSQFIAQEIEQNPLLTADEGEAQEKDETDTSDGADEEEKAAPAEDGQEAPVAEAEITPKEEWTESEGEETGFDSPSAEALQRSARIGGENMLGLDALADRPATLRESLLDQLHVEVSDSATRIIGQHLIDLVDESGYIKDDLRPVADLLGCGMEQIEETLRLLQRFEPVGVCARDLSECLAIQLREKDRLDPAMTALLAHLELVARGDLKALSALCGVDGDDVREMCAEIRALNPRPGNGFGREAVASIEPDAVLRNIKGGWQVELNPAALPRVLVNQRYYAQVSSRARDRLERKYLSDQLAAASWLVKALDQRAQTILKVSTEIVAQQDGFFRHGITQLKPLTLREVAAAVGLHESTVSRVTTSKYMATPRGTYELKYFFNAALSNDAGGESYSNRTVQHLIKEMIAGETAPGALSDDAIASELNARGIRVARRTVAKYRERLRIPSSAARKQENRFSRHMARGKVTIS